MRKSDRINKVLGYIIDHKYTSYTNICNDLGYDRRSVGRYVKSLCDKGYVYTKPGTGGGVFLKEDCILISTILTADQFNSLINLSERDQVIFSNEKDAIDAIVSSVI